MMQSMHRLASNKCYFQTTKCLLSFYIRSPSKFNVRFSSSTSKGSTVDRLDHLVDAKSIKIRFFEEASNSLVEVDAPIGQSVLEVALKNNIEIEGACGGELACSTCHVIVPPKVFAELPPKKVEEEDMLDLAWGVTETSRLCCQLKVTESFQGVEFKVPKETNNML